MAWSKESLERANQSIQEFDKENDSEQKKTKIEIDIHTPFIEEISNQFIKQTFETDSALLLSPASEQFQATEAASPHLENADSAKVFIYSELDLKNTEIERYEVTGTDCYTFHPEKDVLDEIFNRIHMAEMVVVSYEEFLEHTLDGDCIVYANILDGDVDLRLSDLKEGFDISIPVTDGEKEQVLQAAAEYEKNHDPAHHLPKQPVEKASPVIDRE